MGHYVMTDEPRTQSDKFKDAARAAEADPDEKAWEERLKKVAKAPATKDRPE
jgi:hypothetical protein